MKSWHYIFGAIVVGSLLTFGVLSLGHMFCPHFKKCNCNCVDCADGECDCKNGVCNCGPDKVAEKKPLICRCCKGCNCVRCDCVPGDRCCEGCKCNNPK